MLILQTAGNNGRIIIKVPMREFLSTSDILHLENVFFSPFTCIAALKKPFHSDYIKYGLGRNRTSHFT